MFLQDFMAKKQFLHIFAPFLECKKGIFFQNGGQARKMQKNHFFAEMAYTYVGTKYIKRPWDFENFLEFQSTLIIIRCTWKSEGTRFDKIKVGSWSQNHLRDPVRWVGQVFDVKLILPVEDTKAGTEAQPFTIPWNISEDVSQSYG